MKRWFMAGTALVLLAVAAPHARAQGSGPGSGRMRMSEMLLKDITLSDAQKAKIDSITAAYREQFKRGSPGGGPPDSAERAKRREVFDHEAADIRAALNPEQQKVFDKNLTDWHERMQHRGAGQGRGR